MKARENDGRTRFYLGIARKTPVFSLKMYSAAFVVGLAYLGQQAEPIAHQVKPVLSTYLNFLLMQLTWHSLELALKRLAYAINSGQYLWR